MGTVTWHKSREAHNYATYSFLNQQTPTYLDWEVVTIFYSALHIIDAYFSKTSYSPPSDHSDRNHRIKSDPKLSVIRKPYLSLYTLSKSVRYCRDAAPSEIGSALADYNKIKGHLYSQI